MAIDFKKLLKKFKEVDDFDNEVAWFKTKVEWVAPEAYLNVLYKPVPVKTVEEVALALDFPESVFSFYGEWNGAHLFSGSLSIYGCLPERYLLDRASPHSLPNWNIKGLNRSYLRSRDSTVLCLASYMGCHENSVVWIDRSSEAVFCANGADLKMKRKSWDSLEHWLTDEIDRLSFCFDDDGRRLVSADDMLPSASERKN
jgi:hypothetical protein